MRRRAWHLALVPSLRRLAWRRRSSGLSTSTALAAPNLPSSSLRSPKEREKSPSRSEMMGNWMPWERLVALLCSVTLRDEADIIMDLMVTWLSVQTPITCAPTSLKSPSLSLNSLHSLASTSVSLSSMKRRTVNLPSSFSEVTRTNFSPFLVS